MKTNQPIPQKHSQGIVLSLFIEYKRLMFSIAGKYTTDIFEQEDIVQDALMNLLEKEEILQTLSHRVQVSYIKRTVQNTSINYLKKRKRVEKRTREFDNIESDIFVSAESIDDLLIAEENRVQFYKIFQDLSEADQELLSDKYLLELSDTEIAEKVNCKASSIRMKLTRARRNFLNLCKSGGFSR